MTFDRPAQLLAMLIVEAAIGYPAFLFHRIGHPVSWIGMLITTLESSWNTGKAKRKRAVGLVLLFAIATAAGSAGWLIEHVTGNGPAILLIILCGTTGLAQRSLHEHVIGVLRPLRSNDLPGARAAVSRIVGRDTGTLDEAGVSTAAIESLAESFCDGIVAPAFWFLVAGLPGLFVAKAINTADSMVGHRDERFRDFGWASARADDLINLLPARLSGLLIALAAMRGLRTMLRYARHHASPNGGWPEAAMAGAIGRKLGGPVSYDGEPAARAALGDGSPPLAANLVEALQIYRRGCLLLWLAVGALAWLR